MDGALGGTTPGVTTEATLFTIDMDLLSDGLGTVDLLNVTLRDLVNVDILTTVSGATIDIDCTPPPAVTDITAVPATRRSR